MYIYIKYKKYLTLKQQISFWSNEKITTLIFSYTIDIILAQSNIFFRLCLQPLCFIIFFIKNYNT